jgi:sugar (pentulose or hexulose) kinase
MNGNQQMETANLVIGLDCSTTAAKAFAFDRNGTIFGRAHEPIPLSSPTPHQYEQDPNDWWIAAQNALRQLTRQIDPKTIKALAVSNQRETFVPLSAEGHPLRPAIVWLDERCKNDVEWFSKKVGQQRIHRITGKPVDYAPVVYRLAWMKKHEPALFKKIGMICDVHTYMTWKLTGSFKTSWASADPLGLFDLEKKQWSPLILKALGLNETQLPRTFSPGSVLGVISAEVSALTGLSTDTLVVAGGGDGQAAGLGGNVLSPTRAYLNLGTAVVAGVYGRQYRTSKAYRTMCSCSEQGYYYECSLRAGTFALDWFIRKVLNIDALQQPTIYTQLEEEARLVNPGCDGLLHLPYLCGVMNPHWDINARGAFVGLTSFHHRGHLYRSILEGIAFEQLCAIEAVEKSIGTSVREFVAIGGGATSSLWRSILADVTGRDVCIPENTEASALGAGIAAAVGSGWYRTAHDAAQKMSRTALIVRPDKKCRKLYQQRLAAYKKLYPKLKSV